ncbi:unnamed protein product, partial [Scytosiphon promiscuus]
VPRVSFDVFGGWRVFSCGWLLAFILVCVAVAALRDSVVLVCTPPERQQKAKAPTTVVHCDGCAITGPTFRTGAGVFDAICSPRFLAPLASLLLNARLQRT